MGWSGGNEIVDPVIGHLIQLVDRDHLLGSDASAILYQLVAACRGRDWDTAEEVLGRWQDVGWVVDGFRMAGMTLQCGEETSHPSTALAGVTVWSVCDRVQHHLLPHRDSFTKHEWS